MFLCTRSLYREMVYIGSQYSAAWKVKEVQYWTLVHTFRLWFICVQNAVREVYMSLTRVGGKVYVKIGYLYRENGPLQPPETKLQCSPGDGSMEKTKGFCLRCHDYLNSASLLSFLILWEARKRLSISFKAHGKSYCIQALFAVALVSVLFGPFSGAPAICWAMERASLLSFDVALPSEHRFIIVWTMTVIRRGKPPRKRRFPIHHHHIA